MLFSRFVILLVLASILGGCQFHRNHALRNTETELNTTSYESSERAHWLEQRRLHEQLSNADLVLDFRGWREVRVSGKGNSYRSMQDEDTDRLIEQAITTTETHGSNLAVVVVPYAGSGDPSEPLQEERMYQVRDLLRSKGFENVVFRTCHHAVYSCLYPNGLPSKSEIEQIRERRKRFFEHPPARAPFSLPAEKGQP